MRVGVYIGGWPLDRLGGMGVHLRELLAGALRAASDDAAAETTQILLLADQGNLPSARALSDACEIIPLRRPDWAELACAEQRYAAHVRWLSYRDASAAEALRSKSPSAAATAFVWGLDDAAAAARIDLHYFPLPPYVKRPALPFLLQIHDLKHLHRPQDHDAADLARRRRWRRVARAAALVCSGFAHVREDVQCLLGVEAGRTALLPVAPPSDLLVEAKAAHADANCPADMAVAGEEDAAFPHELASRPFALFPAQFWPHKNHAVVIEAVAQLREAGCEVRVLCTGQNEGECAAHAARMRQLAIERGVGDLFLQLGFVDRRVLRGLYDRARLVLAPTLYDPGSFPAYEALARRKPLIAARVTSIPEAVGDAALLFDADSPEQLAAALRRAWTDAPLRRELSERAARQFAGRTWSDVGRDWLALCRQVHAVGLSRVAPRFEADRAAWGAAPATGPLESPLLGFIQRLPAGARYAIYPLGRYTRACFEDAPEAALAAAGRTFVGFVDDAPQARTRYGLPITPLEQADRDWRLDAILLLRDDASRSLHARLAQRRAAGGLKNTLLIDQPAPTLEAMCAHLETYHPACRYAAEFIEHCQRREASESPTGADSLAEKRAAHTGGLRESTLLCTLDAEVFLNAAHADVRRYARVIDEFLSRFDEHGFSFTLCVQLDDSPNISLRTPEAVVQAVIRRFGPEAIGLHGLDHSMPVQGYAVEWLQRGVRELQRRFGVTPRYWAPPGWTLAWRTLRALRHVPEILATRGIWTGVNVRQEKVEQTLRHPYRMAGTWQIPFSYVDWNFIDLWSRPLDRAAIVPLHQELAEFAARAPCSIESVIHPFRLVGADWTERLRLVSVTLREYARRGVRLRGVQHWLAQAARGADDNSPGARCEIRHAQPCR